MDRNTAKQLRTELDALFAKHGIDGFQLELGNCKFSSREATFQLVVRGEGVKSYDEAIAEFAAKDHGYGMTNAAGDRIVGYKPRSPKYPWLVKIAAEGKVYKYPTSMMGTFKKPTA